jgi:Domain of unknown function (DUF1707)
VSEPDESLRVSDAERDAVLRTLGDHAAVGRLTLDELEERSGHALAAKTRGDLATLTSDLPREAGQAGTPAAAPARRRPVRWMVSIMSGSHRRLPPQARGVSLKEARRLAKAAERGELPAPG